jgi:predicted dinucleotide-binding enzyme
VLLAVHWSRVEDALAQAGTLDGTILLDCTNPMNAEDTALTIGHTTSGAEEIGRRYANARVVKAFNTIPSELLRAGPVVLEERAACCFCGDDPDAKQTAARLIRDTGLEPVDAGPLAMARYLEPFALLVAQLAYEQGLGPELGVRFVALPPALTDED